MIYITQQHPGTKCTCAKERPYSVVIGTGSLITGEYCPHCMVEKLYECAKELSRALGAERDIKDSRALLAQQKG